MPDRCHVYLVPGFFGFANIGGITYFHHVEDLLKTTLQKRGFDPVIKAVSTLPTASIERRALRIYEAIEGDDPEGPIFLVGHSTGGVDARLFTSPKARLRGVQPQRVEHWASKVDAVVSVCAPHRGTPMASFFDSLSGAELLYVLSLASIYTMRFGKLPLGVVVGLGGVLTRLDDLLGFDNTIFDQVYENLLNDFGDAHEESVRNFLKHIRTDRSLITELAPARMANFEAAAPDRPTVRYGSVVMRTPKPGWKTMRASGFNPYDQATHVLYRGLHYLTSRSKKFGDLPLEHRNALFAAYGDLLGPKDSDGVVPTYSHPWGEVIHIGQGDHLDTCGHFEDKSHTPPHVDWLKSGSSFTRTDFERLWLSVSDFLAADR